MPHPAKTIPDLRQIGGGARAERLERNRTLIAFDEAAGQPIARIRFWNRDIVLVNDEALIHAVLVEQADSFRKGPLLTRNARPLLGNGLLTSDNDLNRRQRRAVSPPFAHRKIPEYAPLVTAATRRTIASWPDGATLDLASETLKISLDVIGRILFGDDVAEAAGTVDRAIPVLMNFAIDQLRSPLRAALSLPAALQALIALNRVMTRAIRRGESGGADSAHESALIRTLLALPGVQPGTQAMPARLVRDEAMTLFLAGLETVALAVAWGLYLLTEHARWYARVTAEVDAIGRDPEFEDLEKLPATLAVLKEALRLYPPVYIVAREAIRDLDIGGYMLRRGTVVFISAYVRHRRPELFANPHRFCPERWAAPDFERALPRYAFIPFGGGPHVCIGGHFAMMEAQLMLAQMVRRVRFERTSDESVCPEPLFTLRPRTPLRLYAFARRL